MALISWTPQAIEAEIEANAQPTLDEIAQQIAGAAQPPIDTGFLQNSVYTEPSGYGDPWPTGQYPDRNGRMVPRVQSGRASPSESPGAVVGWAAEHALTIEETQPFIYIAVSSTGGGGDG